MAFMNKIGNILRQTQPSISNASFLQAMRCFSSSKLFIGGLSYATDENSLRETFAPYGSVVEARVVVDRETGRSRGFGFISYPSVEEASAAIQALDGRDLHGRFIRVAYASEQRNANRGPRFSSGTGYGTGFGAADGYGANSSQTGGNYSNGGSKYVSSDAGGFDNHDSSHVGANSFNYGASYNSMQQEHGPWQGGNFEHGNNDNNSYSENGVRGSFNAQLG